MHLPDKRHHPGVHRIKLFDRPAPRDVNHTVRRHENRPAPRSFFVGGKILALLIFKETWVDSIKFFDVVAGHEFRLNGQDFRKCSSCDFVALNIAVELEACLDRIQFKFGIHYLRCWV